VIKGMAIGFILAIAISVGCVVYYFSAGLAPVATDDPPMPLEKELANMALDARIEKQHIPPPSVPVDESNFLAGRKRVQTALRRVSRAPRTAARGLSNNHVSQTATIVPRQGCDR
jgi:hypothetical protein